MNFAFKLIDAGLVPDSVIRSGIRKIDSAHLKKYREMSPESLNEELCDLLNNMKKSPLALYTEEANEQHYEIPARFFEKVLGKRKKYSCCLFEEGNESLDEAEEKMLDLTCRRAGIEDGMEILELGCGWGSLTLYMAEHFPNAKILTLSNSLSQGEFIREKCRESDFNNVTVFTTDINDFETDRKFDRVVSVEMFEHLRNYKLLFSKISGWLKDEGRLFFHIFVHREYATIFKAEDEEDWIAKYFFTGGLMPSKSLPLYFQEDLILERQWMVNGRHYQKTADLWLENMDSARNEILKLFEEIYGEKDSQMWFRRWRVFFMACSELWGYDGGKEWLVGHYLMKKRE